MEEVEGRMLREGTGGTRNREERREEDTLSKTMNNDRHALRVVGSMRALQPLGKSFRESVRGEQG